MAKKLLPGTKVNRYRIHREISSGDTAIAYEATGATGQKVFLKQYKSPASGLPWYSAFIAYQKHLQSRIKTPGIQHLCVAVYDAFEAVHGSRCFFQAFEFVSSGLDLETSLGSRAVELSWENRLTFAKRLVGAIAALHERGVVHLDLKPANIHLVNDPSIRVGYQLKLIDMDFSILVDAQPPWANHIGYVGTANYKSPEHLGIAHGGGRSRAPGTAADVYTCGIILYQLLCDSHPFWGRTEEEYRQRLLSSTPPEPAFVGSFTDSKHGLTVAKAMKACLSLDIVKRPGADQLREVLKNGSPATSGAIHPSKVSSPPKQRLRAQGRLILLTTSGQSIRVGLTMELGQQLLSSIDAEARFWSRPQCTLRKLDTGHWDLIHNPAAKNPTLINGKVLNGSAHLYLGDVIAVGRPEKGLIKVPLTVGEATKG